MTRQEIIDYAKAEFAKVPNTRFIESRGSVQTQSLVLLFGHANQPGAVACSFSGLEIANPSNGWVEHRVRGAIRTLLANEVRAA